MTTQTAPANPVAWIFDPSHSSVEFAIKHMVFSTVRGRFNKVDVNIANFDEVRPEDASVEVKVEIASVDTKEEKRDQHLRTSDFFDAQRFPQMTFKSRKVVSKGGGRYDLIGDLTIRGVTREVVLDMTLTGAGKDPWGNRRIGFSAQAAVNRKDFGLLWNVALETGGFIVGDEVKISIDAEILRPAA